MAFIANKYPFAVARLDRKLYLAELFNAAKWRAPGRSWKRNLAKAIVVRMPGTLPLLVRLYDMRFGRTIISLFVVLARA